MTPLNAAQRNDYGLGFWSNAAAGISTELPREAFGLGGAGLNMVVIVPNWNLIVVRTSRVNTFDHMQIRDSLIRRTIGLLR